MTRTQPPHRLLPRAPDAPANRRRGLRVLAFTPSSFARRLSHGDHRPKPGATCSSRPDRGRIGCCCAPTCRLPKELARRPGRPSSRRRPVDRALCGVADLQRRLVKRSHGPKVVVCEAPSRRAGDRARGSPRGSLASNTPGRGTGPSTGPEGHREEPFCVQRLGCRRLTRGPTEVGTGRPNESRHRTGRGRIGSSGSGTLRRPAEAGRREATRGGPEAPAEAEAARNPIGAPREASRSALCVVAPADSGRDLFHDASPKAEPMEATFISQLHPKVPLADARTWFPRARRLASLSAIALQRSIRAAAPPKR